MVCRYFVYVACFYAQVLHIINNTLNKLNKGQRLWDQTPQNARFNV